MGTRTIAIIGAGPIGVEAALYAASLGHEPRLYDRGRLADNVRRWAHVTMFSPWSMNRSPLAVATLVAAGRTIPVDDRCPTGAELVSSHLEPLLESPPLRGRLSERSRVVAIARAGLSKSSPLGDARAGYPFRLLIDGPGGERIEQADVVLDCSGTYRGHNALGAGGLPAIGERALASRIDYELPDLAGRHRALYAGRRVLLVGDGYSAATALEVLNEMPGTRVTWLTRSATPYPSEPDDPLPQRGRLSRLGNELATAGRAGVSTLPAASVERLVARDEAIEVTLSTATGRQPLEVDRVLALVGYRPDRSLYAELQVHDCYASEGPMGLAASLQTAGAGGDCLQQRSAGAETLRTPEPDFHILGAKSYGRNSSFLIRVGLDQVREVYTLIDNRPELDLYGAAAPVQEQRDVREA